MLQSLKLLNYKSFVKQEIVLFPLTVLSGLNASGKSSVINAIRIVNQAAYTNDIRTLEKFNLKFLRSNLVRDKFFKLDMQINNTSFCVEITNDPEKGLSVNYEPAKQNHATNIAYLSADRLGPKNTLPNMTIQGINSVGEFGEYAISYLDKYKYEKISEKLRRNLQLETLGECVNDWLDIIAPGANLSYTNNPSLNNFSILYNDSLPTETGYGLSFTLPVIISLLSSYNDVLLLENPEAHLHPKAQTELGQLIAKSVNNGKQIIVETHSDHLVDGIRIAAKDRQIDNNMIGIYFFERKDMESPTVLNKITVAENGRLSDWPNNFFDQNLKDKAYLSKR